MEWISLGFGKAHCGLNSAQNIWKMVSSVCWIKQGFTFPSSLFFLGSGSVKKDKGFQPLFLYYQISTQMQNVFA
jgi:hypothetical protein